MSGFATRVVDGLNSLLYFAHNAVFRTNPREFIDLASTDDDSTFVLRDGSLVSILQFRGLTSHLYNEQLVDAINEISEKMGRDLIAGGGHYVAMSVECDPDQAKAYADRSLRGSRATARKFGLGGIMDDLFEEKSQKMGEFCQVENTYIAVVTTPRALDPKEFKVEAAKASKQIQQWPNVVEAMLNGRAFPALRTRHQAAVRMFFDDLQRLRSVGDGGIMVEAMSVKSYLKSVKQVIHPGTSNEWEPRIATDAFKDIEVPTRGSDLKGKSMDYAMPKSFGEQLFSENPETIGLKYAVMGNRVYYSVGMTMGPTDPETFDRLVEQASSMRLPFRLNFVLKTGGVGVDFLNTTLAENFPWGSTANRQVKEAYNQLKQYEARAEGFVPAFFLSACTWADAVPKGRPGGDVEYDLNVIQERAIMLNRAIQGWGGAQVSDNHASPIEGVLSCQAGVRDLPLGKVMAPPMPDVVGMSPLFRPTTSWTQADGNLLFRTPDGRFLHYQQTTAKQNAWVTLLVGPMGFSKSTTLNTLNLYYLFTPGNESEIPLLRTLDVGPSSRSIIDLVKAGLPESKQNLAQYIRIQNSNRYQINPFDTPLGAEYPLPGQKSFLSNLLSTLCYAMAKDASVQAKLPGLIEALIKKTYAMYSQPGPAQGLRDNRARTYYPNYNALVHNKVEEHGIEHEENVTTFHEIRDALYDAGETEAALLAHRKAMPTLPELIGVASTEEMRSDYPEQVNGVPLLDLLARSITEAIEMFPIFQGETKFDLGQSRVISLDLEDMVPKSMSDELNQWKASIAFFVGYDLLTRDFFFHEDDLAYIPKRYHRFHKRRVRELATARKRFSMDERQRFAKIPAAQDQVDSLIAEGRKNRVDIVVSSQLFNDHTEKSISLSSTILILGAGNMEPDEQEEVRKRFNLNPQQMRAIMQIRPPSPAGAEVFAVFKTRKGAQAHSLLLSEGSRYLWAIASDAEDRQMRALMYERFTTREALRRLAKRFPGGSVRGELANRLAEMGEDADADNAEESVLEQLVQEAATIEGEKV